MRTKVALLLLACLSVQIDALKILMAGDYDRDRREWYKSVAERLAENELTNNVVYFLTTELALGEEHEESSRLVKFGIGGQFDFW